VPVTAEQETAERGTAGSLGVGRRYDGGSSRLEGGRARPDGGRARPEEIGVAPFVASSRPDGARVEGVARISARWEAWVEEHFPLEWKKDA
jgi:hypothetical protein